MAHASTHPAHPLPPVAPRRLLLAQRLLRGEGSVEVTAFRAGETLTTAVHGVSADGRLVVAHVPNLLGSLGAFHTPAPLDVRVDVLRDALDLTVPTRLASVHLLGTLRWCRDSAEVAELGLRGRVEDLVADVGPRVRVGVVETQRILLHDVDGVAVFCRHTLPLTSRGLVDQAELADLADDVLGTAPEVLADLADAVALGLLPGESTPLQVGTAPLPESPAHALDVDEAGVTLLRVRDGEATAVHVALPGAGRLDHSPRHAWRRLLDAIPARVAHP
ncbi:hypothetical protein M3B32_005780 [Micrococcus luteus]|nr:hypothetical protein [Micrococcus luteus]